MGSVHKPFVVRTMGPQGTSQSWPAASQQLPTDLAAWTSLSPDLNTGTSLEPGP